MYDSRNTSDSGGKVMLRVKETPDFKYLIYGDFTQEVTKKQMHELLSDIVMTLGVDESNAALEDQRLKLCYCEDVEY